MTMDVRKQQMQLQLQPQPQRRQDRTGFETMLDQSTVVAAADGVCRPQHHAVHHRYDHHAAPSACQSDPSALADGSTNDGNGVRTTPAAYSPVAVTTPTSPSQLSLPSPYYDRNPIVIGFPQHHRNQQYQQYSPKSIAPLANVQNMVGDQGSDHNYNGNTSKYYNQWQHHYHNNGYVKSGSPEEDKENIKEKDSACLQQQLDEVLRACVDYEELHKNKHQHAENNGNTSPGSSLPQQNRIKTNGSLPRDNRKSGTSSPTTPSSPSSSVATFSPTSSSLSPSSTAWPNTVTLSPLSFPATDGGIDDSVFYDNENGPSSHRQASTGCGSPKTKMKTLVPSLPSTTAAVTATTAITTTTTDVFRGKDHCGNSEDVVVSKMSPNNLLLSGLQTPPSRQATTTWVHSSPFAANSDARKDEVAELRRKLLVGLSSHKSRLVELHLRREEIDREMIIETALLRAELEAADDETLQSENIVEGLDRAVAECRKQMDMCTVKQQKQRATADSKYADNRRILQALRNRLESIHDDDDDEMKIEIRDSIEKQTELMEAEQKSYEDVEFGLLEEEAGWLARREELHRDRSAAVAVRRARRARREWLRAQLDQLRSVSDDQLRALQVDINAETLSIQHGHKKLLDLDADDQQRRRHRYHHDVSPKSVEWPWDHHQLQSPVSPVLSLSSSSWDQRSKSPMSPWLSTPVDANDLPSMPPIAESAINNVHGLMTSSMTTTCCSSVAGSSGNEDGGDRRTSEDSASRMSMSTIFDSGAGIKLRPKNKTSRPDMTKRPLTRYLPIRYDGDDANEKRMAFDLRAHIESAGHQLDGNDGSGTPLNSWRHFWIDDSSCRGYLKKLSGNGSGKNSRPSGDKWLKRWFVFDRRSRTLSYYRRRSDEDVTTTKKSCPRASIHFQDIQEVYVDHTNNSKGHGCAFVVKTAQRMFYLSAVTSQAVRVWVDVIFTGAEGYREYLKAYTDHIIVDDTTAFGNEYDDDQTKS